MTEDFKCPKFKTLFTGRGLYQDVKPHENEKELIKCSKGNSSYNQD